MGFCQCMQYLRLFLPDVSLFSGGVRRPLLNYFKFIWQRRNPAVKKTKAPIIVFASGTKKGGGSGFQEMVEYSRTNPPVLDALIVGVVSNYRFGGVSRKAESLGIPFEFWDSPNHPDAYRYFVEEYHADFVMLSGWLKKVSGLKTSRTVNIHPGPLPQFGGEGMWGHHVHEAVMAAYHRKEIFQSAMTMHFVDEIYDHGPIICRKNVLIRPYDTAETLAQRVNEMERTWQSWVLNLVVHGHIECLPDDRGGWRTHYRNPYLRRLLMDQIGVDRLHEEDY
jgi:phosphoribosylglycinamide formyltransferase 1